MRSSSTRRRSKKSSRRSAPLVALCALAGSAHADDDTPPARPFHGSVGAGGSLLLAGENGGNRGRLSAELDLLPGGAFGRFGGLVAWRAVDGDHAGLVCAGLVFEAAAARPRLVLDLHADAGADLDQRAPLVGGGIRTTLTIIGPLGVALDTGLYVVIDGVDHSRLVVESNAMVVARW
jgi:hypothetical protein